jgi:hypothetical protein
MKPTKEPSEEAPEHEAAVTPAEWFSTNLPGDWFTGPPEVTVDPEEILVVGPLADGADVRAFREQTRAARMKLADEAQARYRRVVSWGVRTGDVEHLFTTLSTPAMSRLRIRERAVLDTLIAAGVARSRSDALAWCVRLVATHEGDWLRDLRDALEHVDRARREGPVAL